MQQVTFDELRKRNQLNSIQTISTLFFGFINTMFIVFQRNWSCSCSNSLIQQVHISLFAWFNENNWWWGHHMTNYFSSNMIINSAISMTTISYLKVLILLIWCSRFFTIFQLNMKADLETSICFSLV